MFTVNSHDNNNKKCTNIKYYQYKKENNDLLNLQAKISEIPGTLAVFFSTTPANYLPIL